MSNFIKIFKIICAKKEYLSSHFARNYRWRYSRRSKWHEIRWAEAADGAQCTWKCCCLAMESLKFLAISYSSCATHSQLWRLRMCVSVLVIYGKCGAPPHNAKQGTAMRCSFCFVFSSFSYCTNADSYTKYYSPAIFCLSLTLICAQMHIWIMYNKIKEINCCRLWTYVKHFFLSPSLSQSSSYATHACTMKKRNEIVFSMIVLRANIFALHSLLSLATIALAPKMLWRQSQTKNDRRRKNPMERRWFTINLNCLSYDAAKWFFVVVSFRRQK